MGQNPSHYVTPTNSLVEMLVTIRDKWTEFTDFRAQGINVVQPRVVASIKAMVEGFYRDEFASGKVVFDKSRGWLPYIEMMETVLGRPVSVLVTVRDIRAIVASFERLFQQNPMTVSRPSDYALSQTVEGRAAVLLGESGTVGIAVNRLRDAMRRQHKSRVLLIPYTLLCRAPQTMLDRIHDELELPRFKYDPNNVKQLTHEDDSVHGVPLHNVRSKVELAAEKPWEDLLPDALCDALIKQFADIQSFAEAR